MHVGVQLSAVLFQGKGNLPGLKSIKMTYRILNTISLSKETVVKRSSFGIITELFYVQHSNHVQIDTRITLQARLYSLSLVRVVTGKVSR